VEPLAKELFGAVTAPARGEDGSRVIGSFAKGCLAGGTALPVDGPGWQAVRLSRNRVWGHPALIAFVERLAAAARADGWPGLLVGDMAQPRGGPMRTGHASHQIGLDVDLWLTPMPEHRLTTQERESLSAVSMLAPGTRTADPARLGAAQRALIRRAALDPEVARIFVHPGIKQALCQSAGPDRGWLAKVRPWWGHDTHFHVRLACPPGESLCQDQDPPPAGDGCGAELAWWFTDEPWISPPAPPKPLVLADLPAACAAVLLAP
jgi:penicillin-insensitive murein endopeptidase